MKRAQIAEQISEASAQWAQAIEADEWEVAGYWAYRAFRLYGLLMELV